MNNALLYGRDDEKNIVGVTLIGDCTIRVFTRNGADVTHRDEPFRPFAVMSNDGLSHADRVFGRLPRRTLDGPGHFRHLVGFESWYDFLDVRKTLRRADLDYPMYAPPSATTQYLMQTGKTLFKGMTEDDIVRLQLDIETYTPNHGFAQADRASDTITIIVLSDNRGYEKVLHLAHSAASRQKDAESFRDEAEMLRGLVREIQRRDPDVLELHNGFGYDLPYIAARCARHEVNFAIGRDNKPPRTYEATKKLAERDLAYTNFQIEGRHVIDTMFLAGAYDVFTRELPDLTLKGCAKHFGFAREDRVYVPGDEISKTWETDPDRLLEYALDDVRETRGLSDTLAGATFYLTQMVPMTYQATHLSGTATVIESMMVRAYLTARHALPRPQQGRQELGGYTRAYQSGRFEHLVYADVDSLYPGIMLNEPGCLPASDVLSVAHDLLSDLRDQRFVAKAASKDALKRGDEKAATRMKSKEQSFKSIINSMYGAQGFGHFLFNDFAAADNVARNGQLVLHEMMRHTESLGGHVIEADTDGILFVAPKKIETDLDAQAALVKEINARMSRPWVSIGLDGLYKTMISYRAKNYALVDYDGKVKMKGGAFKSRGLEPFLRSYMARQIGHLLAGDIAALWEEHERTKTAVFTRSLGVDQIASRRTLKETITSYYEKRESGNNPQAQYDLAVEKGQRDGRAPERGDVIRYYIAGDKSGSAVKSFEDAKLVEDYAGDENVRFYLRRLHTVAERFRVFFSDDDFGTLFAKPPRSVPSRPYEIPLFDTLTPPDFTNIRIANAFIADARDDMYDDED